MPASEDFYRDQQRLHLVFLGTSVALFAVTIWMLAADHVKPWKDHQREFNIVNREKLEQDLASEQRKLDARRLAALDERLAKEQQELADHQSEIDSATAKIRELSTQLDRQDRAVQFLKADQAEAASAYDLVVGQLAETPKNDPRHAKLERERVRVLERLASLDAKIRDAMGSAGKTKEEVTRFENDIKRRGEKIETTKAEQSKLTNDRDSLKRSIESTSYGLAQKVRALPVIDGFASPVRIKQTVLEELPLDYNFKMVTRFDRCMTCHLAIDKPGYLAKDAIKQPYCSHPHLELYVGDKSPHPVTKFGCTICHQGQGTATSFDWASHTPSDNKQRAEWEKEYGWFFNHFHELPMYASRHIEASCLKCHHDPYQIPQAKKALLGYETIRTHGCYGCHEIDGYKDDGTSIGPNLRLAAPTDSEQEKNRSLRKVGPSLARVSEKVGKDWIWKWIRDPRSFRPSTKMPVFYRQIDTGFYDSAGPEGEFDFESSDAGAKANATPAKGARHAHAKGAHSKEADAQNEHDKELASLALIEVHAITEYLWQASQKNVKATPAEPFKGDPAKGKILFRTKGCVACHNHKEHASLEARGFGPDLSEVGAKFVTDSQKHWLARWIANPAQHNPMTYMPNVQLAPGEPADIAAYLVSAPGKWTRELEIAAVDAKALQDLLLMYEVKGKPTVEEARKAVDAIGNTEAKLVVLGQKTIARLGCFGCHEIPGFEKAKPIGVGLADWGRKDPHKIAFENINEYVQTNPEAKAFYEKEQYYAWALGHHQREGFLMQKLREPRSYDYEKIRRWEDRTRMPQFNLTDEEREALATFVLGLVGETINRKYVYAPPPAKDAEVRGRNLLEGYNCTACHVIKPGEWGFEPSREDADKLVALAKERLAADYDFPGHSAWTPTVKRDGLATVLKGLPDGRENPDEAEVAGDPKFYVRLWEATSLLGQNIPAGIKVGVPSSQVDKDHTPPAGGLFAMWLVEDLISRSANPADPAERDKSWQKAPPPLIREGEKVQTPWLYRFLRDPVSIRPGVALRMPKFNFRAGDVETLANYFAAADNKPFPYVEIPERESGYLAEMEGAHPKYLESGWNLITNKELCVKCHPVGGIRPSGKPEELGPELSRAPERLRPEWMLRWIANPVRIVPYTQMPVNFEKNKQQFQSLFKGEPIEQVRAVRDTLVNYNQVLDAMMIKQQASAGSGATADAARPAAQ